jgi:hypothetical protein
MSVAANIFGAQRTNQGPANPTTSVAQNSRGDLCVTQGLLPKTDVVRLGNSWQASTPTGSKFDTVATWPVNLAQLVISNANVQGGKSFVIDQIWAATLVTETAASQITIVGQMSGAGLVALAARDANVLITSMSGRSGSYNGAAQIAQANSAFAVASKWQVLGASALGGGSVSIGQAALADVLGGVLIQPGATFCMNMVVGTAVLAAGIMGFSWHEVQLDTQ